MNPLLPSSENNLTQQQRLALLMLSLVVLLPGIFGVSLTDRDEGWYAQVSREMLVSGDWLVPHYLGEPWLGKPPLLYWAVCGAYALVGVSAGAARLVSVVSLALSVQLLATLAARLANRRVAWIAGLTFVTAGLPALVGKMLLTDGLLLACTLGAIVLLHGFALRGAGWGRAGAFWVCIGLGMLAKGPAVLVFVGSFGLGLLTLRECRRALLGWRLWVLMPVALVVAGPWYVYAWLRVGDTLVQQLLGYEIVSRLTSAPHGHSGPPGYYVLFSLAGWLPWTVLVPGAVLELWRDRRVVRYAGLLLVWCFVPWVLLELIPSKLPHYILPCYVPLAIMVGLMWDRGLERPATKAQQVVLRLWVLVPAVLGAGLVTLGVWGWEYAWSIGLLVCGVVFLSGFGLLLFNLLRRPLATTWSRAVGMAVTFCVLMGLMLLPGFEPYRLSRNAADQVNALNRVAAAVLVSGYDEPSLFFYLDEPAEVVFPDELARRVRSRTDGVVVLATESALAAADLPEPECGWETVAGVNYVKWQPVVLRVGHYEARGGKAEG